MSVMTTGELSRRTGLPVKAVREYADAGLIYSVGRTAAGYRLFEDEALWCVEVIRGLRALGLTVAEIRSLTNADRQIGARLSRLLDAARARVTTRIEESRQMLASWNGTAPIEASSGDQVRHRLSRAGNRQINRTLHIMATVQLRNPTEGRAYYDRRKAEGKTSMEATRALKRRLSNIVYKTMVDDAITHTVASSRTGPGGQRGNDSDSSAAGSQPHTNSSDKPLPGPATTDPRTALPAAS